MKPMFKIFLFVLLTIASNCSFAQITSLHEESILELKTNLEYLASDGLEGREATTKGEKLAADFISKKLDEYGVKPFGDNGTYFQLFSVDARTVDKNSSVSIFSVDDNVNKLKPGEDFYLSTSTVPSSNYNDKEYEIIFAGYGITADEYDYDSYKNVNANGKVVLLYMGTPMEDDENIFEAEDNNLYRDPNYKIKNAAEHGAAGIIVLPSGFALKYWKWIKARSLTPDFTLVDEEDEYEELIPRVMLSEDKARELLEKERYSFDDLIEAKDENDIPEWFTLSKKILFDYRVKREIKTAINIIGIVYGNDETVKNEYVSFGAHYDHEGIIDGEIFNGADDNGSGTVAILEAARRISSAGNNRRAVIFIFHAAEEKGLLGSKYLTSHSGFVNDIVVNINLDMVGRESDDSIYCIGSGMLSTELYELVQTANKNTVNMVLDYKYDDPKDPNRYYYRSDHYNYAKRGIPIVFFYDHMTEDYHKPTDDIEKINFNKIEKIVTLTVELADIISNLRHKLTADKIEVEN